MGAVADEMDAVRDAAFRRESGPGVEFLAVTDVRSAQYSGVATRTRFRVAAGTPRITPV